MTKSEPDNFQHAFHLLASTGQGILSTHSLEVEGYPFGSITPYCLDQYFRPNILISYIAQHTKNIVENPKVSLTVIEENSKTNKQAKGRLTYIADAHLVTDDQNIKQRYTSYFPESKDYFNTHNFHFYRLEPVRIRYIGGFGKIFWLEQEQFQQQNLIHGDSEKRIVNHMNQDHKENIKDYLKNLLRLEVKEDNQYWMAGLDQFGVDFILEGKQQRLSFDKPMQNVEEARSVFVELAKRAKK